MGNFVIPLILNCPRCELVVQGPGSVSNSERICGGCHYTVSVGRIVNCPPEITVVNIVLYELCFSLLVWGFRPSTEGMGKHWRFSAFSIDRVSQWYIICPHSNQPAVTITRVAWEATCGQVLKNANNCKQIPRAIRQFCGISQIIPWVNKENQAMLILRVLNCPRTEFALALQEMKNQL